MADRIETFQVTIPAGTPVAAPQVTTLAFNDGVVTNIIVTIPPGPSGLVGFSFLHMGSQVIPFKLGAVIIGDDRVAQWAIENQPTASGWQLSAYNLDVYQHTLYIEFLIDEIPITQSSTIPLVPIQ